LLLWASSATAGEYYIEAPPVGTRAEAAQVSRACAVVEVKCRTVRRFHHGLGWEFVVLAEGFEEIEAARLAASGLAGEMGRGVQVFEVRGAEAHVVQSVSSPPSLSAVEASVPLDVTEPAGLEHQGAVQPLAGATVPDLLARVARAHGGSDGGAALLESSEALVFRFRRELSTGVMVEHVYARRGADRYLEVKADSGAVVSSRSVVSGPTAWLITEGGDADQLTFEDASEVTRNVDRFSPETTLGFSVQVARACENRLEFQMAYRAEADSEERVAIQFDGDGVSAPLTAKFHSDDGTLRELKVQSDGGEVVSQFAQYRSVEPGLVVPHEVNVTRDGQPVDRVRVIELDLSPDLLAEWFQRPSP